MANQWFKFYGGDYLNDPKLLGMDGNTRSCWMTLLAYASVSTVPGTIEYLTESYLMIQAGVPIGGEEWRKAEGVLKRFEDRKMIEIKGETITILNWEKRQESHLTDAERAKSYRDRKRVAVTNVTKKSDERHPRIDKNRIEEKTLAEKVSPPWKLEDKLQEMEKKENSYLDIVASFIREKPVVVQNQKQLSAVISRYCRIAQKLTGAYSNTQIFTAVKTLKDDNRERKRKGEAQIDYTLETVYKILTK